MSLPLLAAITFLIFHQYGCYSAMIFFKCWYDNTPIHDSRCFVITLVIIPQHYNFVYSFHFSPLHIWHLYNLLLIKLDIFAKTLYGQNPVNQADRIPPLKRNIAGIFIAIFPNIFNYFLHSITPVPSCLKLLIPASHLALTQLIVCNPPRGLLTVKSIRHLLG